MLRSTFFDDPLPRSIYLRRGESRRLQICTCHALAPPLKIHAYRILRLTSYNWVFLIAEARRGGISCQPSVALVKVFHETIWALLDIAACMLHADSRGAGLDDGKVLEAGCVFQPRLLAFGKALHTTSDFGVYGGPCTL